MRAATEERWWMSGEADVDDKSGSYITRERFNEVPESGVKETYECRNADRDPDDVDFRQPPRLLHQSMEAFR